MSVLADIVAGVREDLAARQAARPLDQIKARAAQLPQPMDAYRALREHPGVAVIAEVKRASPSKGDLAPIGNPAALARQYAGGGATAISVLTEGRRFGGSLDDLRTVCDAVDVPVLCKDFIVASYQLWEAREAGADLVLLIVAALEQPALVSLIERAESLGLTPLVEVHDGEEVERAIDAGARVVGVNARDLKTLDVDPDTFQRVSPAIPSGILRVAESGIRNASDVVAYAHQGAHAVLVGEALVTGADPRTTVAEMVAAGTHPTSTRGAT